MFLMNDLEMFICTLIHALRGIWMYIDDIKDLKDQKKEAKKYILIDFVKIYTYLIIWYPNLKEERKNLAELVQIYLAADRNEKEVLNAIEKYYGMLDQHEGIDELLEEFDDMFQRLFEHCDQTFGDYEDVFAMTGDWIDLFVLRMKCALEGKPYHPADDIRHRMKHAPIRFPVFDDDYKKKMLEYIPKIPKPTEEDF